MSAIDLPMPARQRRRPWLKRGLIGSVKSIWTALERGLPDSLSLRLLYLRTQRRVLHLRRPRSFTEKIQWLKLNYRPPILSQLADKYAVRAYVEQRVGAGILNDLYGVWDRPEQIEFDALPESFALKVTSGTHANIFCRDKSRIDRAAIIAQLNQWMIGNHYSFSREWAYKNITPRIIAEKFLEDGTGTMPADYKFYCFNGKPGFIEVALGRTTNLTITLLSLQWDVLPFSYHTYPKHTLPIPCPSNLEEMTQLAEKLAGDFPYSRVDFYSIGGKTIFGEITFYPGGGLAPFQPFSCDMEIGDMIQLPQKRVA